MRRTTLLIALCLTLVPFEAWAAKSYRYRATSVTTGSDIKEPTTAEFETKVKDDRSKVTFLVTDTTNPTFKEGNYLLSYEGGEVIYLVDVENKTHAKIKLDQVFEVLSAVVDSGLLEMEVANHTVEEVDRRAGPRMHGYSTQYRKIRAEYDLEVGVMRFKKSEHYVVEQEFWGADDLRASGFQAWMKPRKTGVEAIDELLDKELIDWKFPLKSVVTTTSQGKKKKKPPKTTVITNTVTEFESVTLADAEFELPPDSQEIQFVPTGVPVAGDPEGEQEEPEDEEKKGGFMKRLKKARGGDG